MNKSILEDINLLSLTIAGFVAGYLMFITDLALSGFLGLFGTYDIYKSWITSQNLFQGFEDIAIFLGHQINAIIFGFFLVYPKIWKFLPQNRLIKGFIFATIWHLLVLVVSFIFGTLGSIWLKDLLKMGLNFHISLYLLHLVWGVSMALIYQEK